MLSKVHKSFIWSNYFFETALAMAVFITKFAKNGLMSLAPTSSNGFDHFINSSSAIECISLDKYIGFFGEQVKFDLTILCSTSLLIFLIVKQNYEARSRSNIHKKSSRLVQANLLLPFRIPIIIDGLYNLIKFRKDGVKALEEMSEKFGYVYEIAIGPIRTVVIADAVLAQKILCSSQPGHLNKPQEIYGRIFIDWFQDGLVNSDFGTWSPHRKMLSRCFTYKSLQHYLKIMNIHARNLTRNLASTSAASSPNNNETYVEGTQIFEIIYCHAMKIIAQILMGVDKFSEGKMAEFTHNFHGYKHLVLERFMNPHLSFQPYWRFHPKKKEYDRLNSYLTGFMSKITKMHRKEYDFKNNTYQVGNNNEGDQWSNADANDVGEKPFRCVIEEMLRCNATDKEIYDEVGTLLGTGHETSVVAIQMLLLHLALNPEHQTKCREEVDILFQQKECDGGDSTHGDWKLSMDDLSNLKYLERCILESGRITSTVPIFLRRLDAPLKFDDDLELDAGSNIAILPWVMHKNPKYFPDPEKFDPDRFLPENVKQRHPYAYTPRNCIGWKVALMEIKVIMAYILRDFEIFSSDKLEDVKLLFEVTLLPERNYNITLKRRQNY